MPNSEMPPMDDCKQCLSEHKDMIEQISKLKKEITTLTSTHKSLNQTATTIRYGMDRLMQAATRSNITIN
jgi:cell division septum initiation protein DivIVA